MLGLSLVPSCTKGSQSESAHVMVHVCAEKMHGLLSRMSSMTYSLYSWQFAWAATNQEPHVADVAAASCTQLLAQARLVWGNTQHVRHTMFMAMHVLHEACCGDACLA